MIDKAERVAKLIWDGVYGNGHVPPIAAAILREEYPEKTITEPITAECAQDPESLCNPWKCDARNECVSYNSRPAPDVSALRDAIGALPRELAWEGKMADGAVYKKYVISADAIDALLRSEPREARDER